MTDSVAHLSDEVIYALARAPADSHHNADSVRHTSDCVRCRQRLENARALLRAVDAAPRAIDVPEDWWPAIRARIGARNARSVGALNEPAVPAVSWRAHVWRMAAVLVVTAGLSTAALLVAYRGLGRRRPETTNVLVRVVPGGVPSVRAASSTPDASTDAQVERELLAELELRRGELRPATVAQIEGHLRTIDSAITDLRAELARNPDDPTLTQLLADSYAHKSELLKLLGNAS